MGTRADFYVGAGKDAEWLGSIAYDGYFIDQMVSADDVRDGSDRLGWAIKQATTADEFRAAVAALLASSDDGTTPDQGWPWPWETSDTTDYAYCFDAEKLRTFCFGAELLGQYDKDADERAEGPGIEFPNMKDRQSVTYVKRSGMLIFGFRPND